MSRLLETIKIADGKICNVAYHNRRLNESRKECFGYQDFIDLNDHIFISDFHSKGIYKCRVLYGKTIELIEVHKYRKRPIQSLKIVHHDTIDYKHKYEDRTALARLFGQRCEADDILIIKNGRVTDSYYCNIAFRNSDGRWLTPSEPLLRGTKRQRLLEEGLIYQQSIRVDDIAQFDQLTVFNSMIELGEIQIPLKKVWRD